MFRKNPYINLIRLYWRFVPNRKLALLMWSFSFISTLINLLAPFFIGKLINVVQKGGPNMRHQIVIYLILFALVPFVSWMFHGTSRVWENKLNFRTQKAYKLYLFQAVTSFGMAWHTDHHSWETIDKIEKATGGMKDFAGQMFMYLGTFVRIAGAFWALILIWPTAILISTLTAIVVFFLIWFFDLRLVDLTKQKNQKEHQVASLLYDYLSNIKTIITLRFIERTRKVIDDKMEEKYPPVRTYIIINEWKWFIVNMVLIIAMTLMIGRYAHSQLVVTWTILIGSLTMIFQYMQEVENAFYEFAWQYAVTVQNNVNVMAVDDIIQEYEHLPEAYQLPPLKNRKTIAIKGLHFTYKDAHKRSHTLHDIDLTLHAWEKIAVVGESGSGKSTFLSLLRGLYDVDSVTVEVDTKKYDHLHILSHNTSLIPQEPEIFEDTMRYNITVGLDTDNETIETFSRMACFHDVALSLAHGYEASIKEKWVNLSWGQKQRLALARGLLVSHESDIILLDESTSSVDSINERKIYQNIFEAYPQKTIVAAIHKLHLLPLFQKIYVFDEGKIIESGTCDELIAHNGMFARMRKEYQVDMHEEKII